MGHIFISYNHKDAEYAHKLANTLKEKGFNVWIDDAIESGSEWPLEIQEHLDACDVFVVIMTSASYQSKWVQNELNRAMRKNKTVFPLLLDGAEPWLSVEATQYTDVRGGKLPSERFYSLLANATSQNEQTPSGSFERKKNAKRLQLSNRVLLFAVFIGIIVVAALVAGQFLAQAPDSTPTTVATLTLSITLTETNVPTVPTGIPATEIVREFISVKDGMKSLLIPAGAFTMGSNNGNEDERPSHPVTLSDYWIDETEVTNDMYRLCVESGACDEPDNLKSYSNKEYAQHPVVYVDWEGAQKYCAWAGRRLPTEAEWEKAARGPSGNLLPWAGPLDCLHANYGGCIGKTEAVGSYPQSTNEYGVLDMLGNVWEWVYDKYNTNYYKDPDAPSVDPAGPSSGNHRILRGAAWDTTDAIRLRVTFRYNRAPNLAGNSYGFRCATSQVP